MKKKDYGIKARVDFATQVRAAELRFTKGGEKVSLSNLHLVNCEHIYKSNLLTLTDTGKN